jgi:hypothetical protein
VSDSTTLKSSRDAACRVSRLCAQEGTGRVHGAAEAGHPGVAGPTRGRESPSPGILVSHVYLLAVTISMLLVAPAKHCAKDFAAVCCSGVMSDAALMGGAPPQCSVSVLVRVANTVCYMWHTGPRWRTSTGRRPALSQSRVHRCRRSCSASVPPAARSWCRTTAIHQGARRSVILRATTRTGKTIFARESIQSVQTSFVKIVYMLCFKCVRDLKVDIDADWLPVIGPCTPPIMPQILQSMPVQAVRRDQAHRHGTRCHHRCKAVPALLPRERGQR